MLKTLLILFGLSITSHAIVESQIQKVMETKIDKVLHILKTKSLTIPQKERRSIKIIDTMFDYKTMAKISLGRYWKRLSKEQKEQFTKAFEHKIKHSYVDKLRLYHNQKVVIDKIKKIKSTRIILKTQIIGKTETYNVIYHFYKDKKKNEWYIYDVRLAGVSIIQTYRQQFKAFLKTKTFKQLLDSL